MWQPNERYPDASVRVLDPSFNKYRLPLASVERLYTGCRWSEGPVYFGDGRYLLWSDIPNNRVLRWDEDLSQALQQRQRPYARPARPADRLRARCAAGRALRV
jgi:sugar lactone lactonase YvrE